MWSFANIFLILFIIFAAIAFLLGISIATNRDEDVNANKANLTRFNIFLGLAILFILLSLAFQGENLWQAMNKGTYTMNKY